MDVSLPLANHALRVSIAQDTVVKDTIVSQPCVRASMPRASSPTQHSHATATMHAQAEGVCGAGQIHIMFCNHVAAR